MKSQSSHFKLWSELELQEFAGEFVIRSVESPDQGFSVTRSGGNIDELNGDEPSGSPSKVSTIYGVAGTIRLLAGTYILVITSRKEVGTYLGFPVFLVTSMKFLSCNKASTFLTSQEKRDEEYFMTLLKIVESTPGLYYSYGTDMTLSLQRRFNLAKGWKGKPIWKQGDPRFVWNRNLLEDLIENKLDGFIIPLLQGTLSNWRNETEKFSRSYKITFTEVYEAPSWNLTVFGIESTTSGTRMWRRGANLEGDTANFIETEQLLEFEGQIFSFLQRMVLTGVTAQSSVHINLGNGSLEPQKMVRGSIPLLWEQIADLSYKPQLRIINHEDTSKIVECHFNDLSKRYGGCIVINLADKHGDEGFLSAVYAEEMQKHPDVRYVSFDFHQFCGNGNLDNIHILYDEIAEDFGKQGYFLLDSKGKILAEQKGVLRSNCIDCLDRTNVTQSYLAQKSLYSQLQRAGAISSTECISMFSKNFEIFKTIWVENGDYISLEYSGTHALKRDLVRYGKQTMSGIIKDGLSAISRYYLNNFQDGAKQDAIDLISGRYSVNSNSHSSYQCKGQESISYLPVASALVLGGLTVTSLTIDQGENAEQVLSSMVCAGVVAGLMAIFKSNGRQICSKPRLCNLF